MTSRTDNQWTPDLVREYAAGAPRLEMWTIPLYLCVAYSIVNPDDPNTPITFPEALRAVSEAGLDSAKDTRDLRARLAGNSGLLAKYTFYSIMSVAIQEMLHAELAANLCNAIGGQVDFTGVQGNLAPVYNAQHVPYINVPPDVAPLVRLGNLNQDSIQLLQWIEHYDPPGMKATNGPRPKYDSIGDFYQSLKYGIDTLWTKLYPPPDDLKQKNDWQTQVNGKTVNDYSFSIEISGPSPSALQLADTVIDAIVSQGEGAQSDGHKLVNPAFRLKQGSGVEIIFDIFTHWERFTAIRDLLSDGAVIKTWHVVVPPPDRRLLEGLQTAMRQGLSSFLDTLQQGFNSMKPLDLDSMAGLGSRMYVVWLNGGIPDLSYQAYEPIQYPHACQGLNACAGQGANDTGTGPGDGDCATAWYHACGATNKCSLQGACGYAVTTDLNDFKDNWIPNQNTCAGKGGCGTPIPDKQVFNTVAPDAAPSNFPDGDKCAGADPWARARKIFEEQHPHHKPAPPTNKLRKALNPTAT